MLEQTGRLRLLGIAGGRGRRRRIDEPPLVISASALLAGRLNLARILHPAEPPEYGLLGQADLVSEMLGRLRSRSEQRSDRRPTIAASDPGDLGA